jgi:hypothetical protein
MLLLGIAVWNAAGAPRPPDNPPPLLLHLVTSAPGGGGAQSGSAPTSPRVMLVVETVSQCDSKKLGGVWWDGMGPITRVPAWQLLMSDAYRWGP